VSWYGTTSLAHAKVRSVADITGSLPVQGLAPKPIGSGNSLRHPAIVVLSFLFAGTWCRKHLSFVLGGPPKGLCLSLVSFLYLSFLTCLEEGIAPSCFRLRCCEGGGWAQG